MTKSSNSHLKRWIFILLLICIGTRLLFFAFEHPWQIETEESVILYKDALGYHNLACTLIEHKKFAFSPSEEPNTTRTPLYPLFIAGVYVLFGYKPWLVLLFQIFLGTLACYLFILALKRLFNPQVAIIASLFYVLNPFLILYTSTLLSDVLFVFLLIVMFYWFSLSYKAESPRKALIYYGLSGFFLGLATLVRPLSQYVPIIFIVFILFWFRKNLKDAFKYALSLLIMFVVALSPWLIRNYHLFGHLAVSSSGSYNLLLEYAVPMEMHKRNQDTKTVQDSLLAEAEEIMRTDGLQPESLNSFQKAEYYKSLAIQYITGSPMRFLKTYVLGLLHTFANLDTSTFTSKLGIPLGKVEIKEYPNLIDLIKDFITQKGPLGLLIAGLIIPYLIISYLGLAAGLIVSWKRYDKGILIWCFLLAAYFILVTGVAGTARFKIPAMPFYFPFTAIGLAFLWTKIRRKRNSLNSNFGARE